MGTWLRSRVRGGPRLKISQSLGAFSRPGEGDISPLHVFFDVTNAGPHRVEVVSLRVAPRGSFRSAYEGPFGGDKDLPCALDPGESARFWTLAKKLAASLEEAGHGGSPRVRFVVEDADGNRFDKAFKFRVDEYLRLKDE
jgi:hypothetical protein